MTTHVSSTGEFGVVYKAHLVKTHSNNSLYTSTVTVAVKTLKGECTFIYLVHSVERLHPKLMCKINLNIQARIYPKCMCAFACACVHSCVCIL